MEKCTVFTGEVITSEAADISGKMSVPVKIIDNLPLEKKEIAITENGPATIYPGSGYYGMSSLNITTNVTPVLQALDVPVTKNGETVLLPREGYDGFSRVSINTAVLPNLETAAVTVTGNGQKTVTPSAGYDGLKSIDIETEVHPPLEEAEIEIASGSIVTTPSEGYYGLSKVTVNVTPSEHHGEPNPSWWDIESIVQNESNQEFPYKCIQLLPDAETDTLFTGGVAYKTSDGRYYTSNTITHTWDASKDKICITDGIATYRTRWFITYFNGPEVAAFTASTNCLYFVMDGIRPLKATLSYRKSLTTFKFINGADFTRITNFGSFLSNCNSLVSVPVMDTSNGTAFDSMFSSCSALISVPELNTGNGTNFSKMFRGCSSLISVPSLNTGSGTDLTYMFSSCFSINSIPALHIGTEADPNYAFSDCNSLFYARIKVFQSGVNLSYSPLNIASIMYTIDSLPHTDNPKTLVLGSSNLAKLTNDQKAAATNKGWTLS